MRVSYVKIGLALILTAAGCGKSDQPVTFTGKLTLNDEPVAGALVSLVREGKQGRDAHAQTRADGSFELTTLPGEYKVLVEYHEPAERKATYRNQQEAMRAVQQGQDQPKKPPRYVIPLKYSDPSQTPLRQKVPPDGEVVVKLQSHG